MSTFKTKAGTELPILDLKGKPYLQVAYRIQWCREENPKWIFNVSFIRLDDAVCIAKAEIVDETGAIRAVAHKREDKQGFFDFMEKAETGAIGRALAMLGYGTQFTGDELDEGERLADAPVARSGVNKQRSFEDKPPVVKPVVHPPNVIPNDVGPEIVKQAIVGAQSAQEAKSSDPGEMIYPFAGRHSNKRLALLSSEERRETISFFTQKGEPKGRAKALVDALRLLDLADETNAIMNQDPLDEGHF